MPPTAIPPEASEGDRYALERLLNDATLSGYQRQRLQVVLARIKGRSPTEISETLNLRRSTIAEVVRRFNSGGLEALLHPPTNYAGGKARVSDEKEQELVELVKTTKPHDATHWSTRELAKRVGMSHTAVHQILRKHELKPHLVKGFRSSTDPQFREKLEDIVGLYMNPPENAAVLCVDEKSQIQALERMQPILPLQEGVPERQSHDYLRHGTTTLFAALRVATGNVIGTTKDRHRASEFIAFLKLLDREMPNELVLHIVADNLSSHKTKAVTEYLESRAGRFVIHHTPTHSSWLNLIERWFAELTNKQIRRGSWKSKRELEKAIYDFIHQWNQSGKTFQWTKSAGDILVSVEKATQD